MFDLMQYALIFYDFQLILAQMREDPPSITPRIPLAACGIAAASPSCGAQMMPSNRAEDGGAHRSTTSFHPPSLPQQTRKQTHHRTLHEKITQNWYNT